MAGNANAVISGPAMAILLGLGSLGVGLLSTQLDGGTRLFLIIVSPVVIWAGLKASYSVQHFQFHLGLGWRISDWL